jgi:hypothetical protein
MSPQMALHTIDEHTLGNLRTRSKRRLRARQRDVIQ